MSWVLTVVSGSRRGDAFPLRDGLSIGRKSADIALEDRRVSGLHALVRGGGLSWSVEDNGSKNGLKDARGTLVASLKLEPKLTFTIGDTTFRVDAPERAPAVVPVAAVPVPDPVAAAPPARLTTPRQTWYDVLAKMLVDHGDRFRDYPRALTPLEPALVLEFVRGPQVNSRWILGYGPRRVGPGALDLPLWEPDVPAICFELIPGKDGLIFRTEHRELVRLNGRAVDSDVLRGGDTIQIKDTLIEVDFTE